MRDRFSMYRRGAIWYARFYNPQRGKYLTGRSTRETNRNSALLVVAQWIRDGLPDPARGVRKVRELLDIDLALSIIRKAPMTPDDVQRIIRVLEERELIRSATVGTAPQGEPFLAFLERFWDFASSPYVRERLAHGQRISRRHCYDARKRLDYYWRPYFGDEKILSQVTKSEIAAFSLALKEDRALKANTINNILAAGTVALRWAARNDLIPRSPAEGPMTFAGKAAKRGVLSDDEVQALFASPWRDEHSKIGNMLAMSTGLRAGEILALQFSDIGDDRLRIRHSWNRWDKIKGTKTDLERTVPVLASMRDALLRLAKRNPNGVGPATYVFWSSGDPGRPMEPDRLLKGLRRALLRLKLSEKDWKDPAKMAAARQFWQNRRVVFHSWRHYFAARMADRLEKRKVMLATGHATGAVFDAYADHSNEEVFHEVQSAAAAVFGKLLHFPMAAAPDAKDTGKTTEE